MPIVNIFTNLVDIFIKKKHFTNNVTFFPLSDNSSKSTEQILDTMISELHLYKMDDLLKLKNILEQYEDKNFRPLHMVLLDLKFRNEIFNELMLKLFNNKLERFQIYMILDRINLEIYQEIRFKLKIYSKKHSDNKPNIQEFIQLLNNDGIFISDESIMQEHIKELLDE